MAPRKRKSSISSRKQTSNGKRRKATANKAPDSVEFRNKKLDEFCDNSRFMAVEVVDRSIHAPDLDNAIHAIWRPDNFRNVNYRYVEMPARLTTRFWDVLVGEEKDAIDMIVNSSHNIITLAERGKDGEPYSAYLPPKGPPEDRKRAVDSAVSRLSNIVRFEPSEDLMRGGSTLALNPDQWPSDLRNSTRINGQA